MMASTFLLFITLVFSQSTFSRVKGLPGEPSGVEFQQFAGLLQVNKTCPAFLFAWLAKSIDLSSDDVVVFLNGGPGSSSFLGWFFENIGPFSIQADDMRLSLNPFAWNRKADLIIFDQPAGVGLSWTTNSTECLPKNTQESSAQLAEAIAHLFETPEYGLTGKRLWLFGESYAGTWIPLLARQLLQFHDIYIAGIGLGDGWVSPVQQQSTYADFAKLHGLINGPQFQQATQLQTACVNAINSYPSGTPLPSSVNDICNNIEEFIVNVSNVNVLDVRTTDNYDFSAISSYLNRQQVFSALNLPQDPTIFPWNADSDAIGDIFSTGEQNSVADVVSDILTLGIPTLIYNGVYDMDCNFVGTDSWLESCAWGTRVGLYNFSRNPWTLEIGGKTIQAGMFRVVQPLSQVVLANCGHLVPFNEPAVAQAMLEQFIAKKQLA